MEYVQTITAMSTSGALTGDVTLTNKAEETYADAKRHVRAIIEWAENHGDGNVKVMWTHFRSRSIEKCAVEWYYDNTRMTDVVWFKRGQRWG